MQEFRGAYCTHHSSSRTLKTRHTLLQSGDMKGRPGNGIEGAMVCTSLGSLLRPLFYFLDDVSYPHSVYNLHTRKYNFFLSAENVLPKKINDVESTIKYHKFCPVTKQTRGNLQMIKDSRINYRVSPPYFCLGLPLLVLSYDTCSTFLKGHLT